MVWPINENRRQAVAFGSGREEKMRASSKDLVSESSQCDVCYRIPREGRMDKKKVENVKRETEPIVTSSLSKKKDNLRVRIP